MARPRTGFCTAQSTSIFRSPEILTNMLVIVPLIRECVKNALQSWRGAAAAAPQSAAIDAPGPGACDRLFPADLECPWHHRTTVAHRAPAARYRPARAASDRRTMQPLEPQPSGGAVAHGADRIRAAQAPCERPAPRERVADHAKPRACGPHGAGDR